VIDNTGQSQTPEFDELPGALLAYDEHGRVVRANRTSLDILGFDSEHELVGSLASEAGWFRTDPAGWPDARGLHPALAAIRSGQPERRVIARVTRPDGDEVWIRVRRGRMPH
jgi:PAS domain-containing protein